MSGLSPAARLLLRPFRGYAELAAEEEAPTILGGAALLLFALGAFVSFTAAGRLVPLDLALAFGAFAYVPLVQAVALGAATRLVARDVPFRRAFALYLAGHGPYVLLFFVVEGVCLFAPEPAGALLAVAPPLALGIFAWGALLTFACFRAGVGLDRRRAAAATGIFYASSTACVLGYFLAAGQLWPILPR